jgi:hypothetical protein
LKTAFDRSDELVRCPAAPFCVPDDRGNTRQHVFDRVVELGAQQVLTVFGLLAPRDIAGQTFPRRFLQPRLPAVGADETKDDSIGGAVGAQTAIVRLEAPPGSSG